MAQSVIQYPVFLTIGEVKVKFQTKDGGRHLTYVEPAELPAGVSKEGFEHVFGKLLSMARAETVRIEKEKTEAKERARQAKEAENARIAKQVEEDARQTRFMDFIQSNAKPQPLSSLKYDGPTLIMHDYGHAIRVAKEGKLPFLGAYMDRSQTLYIFENTDNLDRCERCASELKPAGGGMYTRTFVCTGCGERVHRSKTIERKSQMSPNAFSLVG